MTNPTSWWQYDVLPIRIISAAVPLLFILSGFLFTNNFNHWTFLLLMATVLGYVHFAIATVYQYEGILRNPQKQRLLKWFYSLLLLGLATSIIAIAAGYTLLLSILTITYFVLHVLANEHTFLSRIKAITLPYWLMLTLIIPIIATYAFSLTHESLFFSYDLLYSGLSLGERVAIISGVYSIPLVENIAFVALVVFTVCIPALLIIKYKKPFAAVLYAGFGLATIALIVSPVVINFMYLLHFVLVYHFVLLSVLFIQPMRQLGPKVWETYWKRHVYLLIPLLLLAAYFMYELQTPSLFDYLFHFQIFLTLSITHITASMLNEDWFKNIFFKPAN